MKCQMEAINDMDFYKNLLENLAKGNSMKDQKDPDAIVDLYAMDHYKDSLEEWAMDKHLFYIHQWEDQSEEEFEGEEWDDLNTMYEDTFTTFPLWYRNGSVKNLKTGGEFGELIQLDHTVTANNVNFVIPRIGDFVQEMELEIPYEDNLNAWMDCVIEYEIGDQRIFSGTIRCVVSLLGDIEGHRVTPDFERGTVKIPLQISSFLSRKRLDIVCISYHETKLCIALPDNRQGMQLDKLRLCVMCGFMPCKPRHELSMSSLSMLITQSSVVSITTVKDQYDEFWPMVNGLTIFIIVWYVMDTSFFAENQLLQPDIVTAEWEIGSEFTHEYRLSEIKKLKCGNYTGFVFPINRFLYDGYIKFAKKLSQKTDLEKLNQFINYSQIDAPPKLKILWSGYQPGATLIVEQMSLNEYQMKTGTGRLKYLA